MAKRRYDELAEIAWSKPDESTVYPAALETDYGHEPKKHSSDINTRVMRWIMMYLSAHPEGWLFDVGSAYARQHGTSHHGRLDYYFELLIRKGWLHKEKRIHPIKQKNAVMRNSSAWYYIWIGQRFDKTNKKENTNE